MDYRLVDQSESTGSGNRHMQHREWQQSMVSGEEYTLGGQGGSGTKAPLLTSFMLTTNSYCQTKNLLS